MCGFAVLIHFICGFAVLSHFICGFAVLEKHMRSAVFGHIYMRFCGIKAFYLRFYGFEELYEKTPKIIAKKILRFFYRKIIRFLRTINANPNPYILDPVFYAVAQRKI